MDVDIYTFSVVPHSLFFISETSSSEMSYAKFGNVRFLVIDLLIKSSMKGNNLNGVGLDTVVVSKAQTPLHN